MKNLLLALMVPIFFINMPAAAKGKDPNAPVLLEKSESLQLDPSRAYILFRGTVKTILSPFLMRELSKAEIDDYIKQRDKSLGERSAKEIAKNPDLSVENHQFVYEGPPNIVEILGKKAYDKEDVKPTYLVSVPPGKYVVMGAGNGYFILTCYCMGTVKFEAKPGMITDLGLFIYGGVFGREPSPSPESVGYPELSGYVGKIENNLPPQSIIAMAIRPYADGMPIPVELNGFNIVQARYEAVGKLPNYIHTSNYRLAPLPGVLGYESGKVIDLKTGKEAD